MKTRHLFLVAVACAAFGSGCVAIVPAPQTSLQVPSSGPAVGGQWINVGVGIDRLDYQFATSTDASLRVYRFASKKFSWTFQSGEPRRVADWMDASSDAVALMNGVYFKENEAPAGYLMAHGEALGKNKFDLDKSALIEFAPAIRILDTENDKTDFSAFTEAAQSYPLLVRNGVSALSPGSQLAARRSVFGLDAAGNVYLGVVSDYPVTLYDLSQVVLSTGVPWTNVVNLDGGPSTGLAVKTGTTDEVINSDAAVPIVIIGKPVK